MTRTPELRPVARRELPSGDATEIAEQLAHGRETIPARLLQQKSCIICLPEP